MFSAFQAIHSATIEKPDEIQLMRFESEEQFRSYFADPQRIRLLSLKEDCVRMQILIKVKAM